MRNYYDILGVSKEASDKEIKTAYRKLSKEYHPDRQAGKSEEHKKMCEEKMKEINEAYATLSDSHKRQEYDNPAMGGGFGEFDFGDMGDFMREAMRGFGFGGRQSRQNASQKGSDIHMRIPISIDEILHGCEKKVKYTRQVRCSHCHGQGGEKKIVCPYCHGQGFVEEVKQMGPNSIFKSTRPCPHCNGRGFKFEKSCTHCNSTGFETKEEIINIRFDAGVIEGQPFIAQGRGNESNDIHGVDGNFCAIPVYTFNKEEYNLDNFPNIIHKVKLNWYDALLGGEFKIKLEGIGERQVTVNPCTKIGDTITLHGLGAKIQNPDMFGRSYQGDYILFIDYKFPESLTDEQRRYLKKIKDIS